MAKDLLTAMDTNVTKQRVATLSAPPEPVTSFLGRLTLLHGVPFSYLVADEKLLPRDSLRFFFIDPEWVNALVGGALSVGPTAVIPPLLNKTVAGNYATTILTEARSVRARQRSEAPPPASEKPVDAAATFSGFLFRSRLLQAWPGLEVRACDAKGELAILRLDRVAPDVLFGLLEGSPSSLQITQPAEGLHFVIERSVPKRDDGVIDIKAWADNASSGEFASTRIANSVRLAITIEG